ncbi:Nuclear hormone receptor family member nhr-164 [Caenorhabditis elegans]|uniref:Nuclear hormone receptor family member nhr-164 n=1 Tax=Caenorhabditis elegans TaxID=6239 RepID=UPI00077FE564|nr:Nuclear hormone receptor family member nhr-164 [Caenorhabditis elegans]CAB02829.2 Nuclear hormone receptor family member nhr-164 [Caenorhabditis elegans]|eukprot:NP_001309454.1 Nuclear hormone receptor family member nhr-164 [Caenorhabditis elegans]
MDYGRTRRKRLLMNGSDESENQYAQHYVEFLETMSYTKFGVCAVCGFSCQVQYHFGGVVCGACSAFFRRTVSLNIRYLCDGDNQCKSMLKKCRACRFESCVKTAGMKRSLVRRKKPTIKTTPLYIKNRETHVRNEDVLRAFIPSYTHPSPANETVEDKGKFSEKLKLSHGNILKFYINQVRYAKRKNTNIFTIKTTEDFMRLVNFQRKIADETCSSFPGVELIDENNILILRKYLQFSSVWIESTWTYWITNSSVSVDNMEMDKRLKELIEHVKSTLLISLSQLKLNIFEFAAFKSFFVWKLVFHKTSVAMKTIGQEHYECVSSALKSYYQTYTSMDSTEIAVRIGEITLLLSLVFQIYHDMAKLYVHLGLPF